MASELSDNGPRAAEQATMPLTTGDQRTAKFGCYICAQNCGMVATLEGERIVKVKGDSSFPHSGGYTCVKGRSIPTTHHRSDRLDRPRLNGEDVSWDTLLDDLAASLQRVTDESGVDRIAFFSGTGANWNGTGHFAWHRLITGLGTRQKYTATTLDSAPAMKAAELILGFSNFPAWEPERPPSLMLISGLNPPVSGGHVGAAASSWVKRIQAFRKRGGELWVADPRETKTARIADRHLAVRPGTDVFLFGWLVRELLKEGYDPEELEKACRAVDIERLREAVAPFELTEVATRTGLAANDLTDLLAAIRRHGKFGIVPGTGVVFQKNSILAYWFAWAAMIITGSLDREGGLRFIPAGRGVPDSPLEGHAPEDGSFFPGPASRPDLPGVFGEQPAVALADEIEAGELRALLVFGANPLVNAPNPDRIRAALERLDVLAVLDVFDGPLAEMATHTLPCSWITEHSNIMTLPRLGIRRASLGPALVQPAAERRHEWWSLAQIGRRLGIDVLDGLDPDTVDDETVARHVVRTSFDYGEMMVAASPDGIEIPTSIGWVHEKVLPDGRWRLAPAVLIDRLEQVWRADNGKPRLISGRILSSVNNAVYAGDPVPPPIHVSPDTAQEFGIETGDRIRVSTPSGSLDGEAKVDDEMRAGSVWINHGWVGQNVNRITDPEADRLSGQPVFTGIPLELERLDSPVGNAR
jgi:anaerobic selenocysteine-containing dehydrogenase